MTTRLVTGCRCAAVALPSRGRRQEDSSLRCGSQTPQSRVDKKTFSSHHIEASGEACPDSGRESRPNLPQLKVAVARDEHASAARRGTYREQPARHVRSMRDYPTSLGATVAAILVSTEEADVTPILGARPTHGFAQGETLARFRADIGFHRATRDRSIPPAVHTARVQRDLVYAVAEEAEPTACDPDGRKKIKRGNRPKNSPHRVDEMSATPLCLRGGWSWTLAGHVKARKSLRIHRDIERATDPPPHRSGAPALRATKAFRDACLAHDRSLIFYRRRH